MRTRLPCQRPPAVPPPRVGHVLILDRVDTDTWVALRVGAPTSGCTCDREAIDPPVPDDPTLGFWMLSWPCGRPDLAKMSRP